MNIFQGWIIFRCEYFSWVNFFSGVNFSLGVNIFQGWIFLRWILFRVNIFHIWIFPSEDSHSLLGLVFTFIQVWKQRSRRCWFLHDQLVLICNLQIWRHSSLCKCLLSYLKVQHLSQCNVQWKCCSAAVAVELLQCYFFGISKSWQLAAFMLINDVDKRRQTTRALKSWQDPTASWF